MGVVEKDALWSILCFIRIGAFCEYISLTARYIERENIDECMIGPMKPCSPLEVHALDVLPQGMGNPDIRRLPHTIEVNLRQKPCGYSSDSTSRTEQILDCLSFKLCM